MNLRLFAFTLVRYLLVVSVFARHHWIVILNR